MKSYCVKEKRETECVPGTEQTKTARNGRLMMKCTCAECGATKTKFISGQTGGAINYACGTNLRGKRPGNQRECLKSGQIRRYGLNPVDDEISALINEKLKPKPRKTKKWKIPTGYVPSTLGPLPEKWKIPTGYVPSTLGPLPEKWKIPTGYVPSTLGPLPKSAKKRNYADETVEMDSLLSRRPRASKKSGNGLARLKGRA